MDIVFTSCNLAYLERAIVLARTIKLNSSAKVALMLSDYLDQSFLESSSLTCFDYIVDTSKIGIENFEQWSFQYDVVELCTAVKGFCFQYLFKQGFNKVLYLDPDIACYSSIDFLFDLLDQHSILLTPHQLSPANSVSGVLDNELCSHKHGIFNLGFLGLNKTHDGIKFLTWWSERLRNFCLDDIPNGMFTDQKWCDAVPSYFNSYHIVRHPGCNVASWNLYERRLSIKKGVAYVNNDYPLVFYHYTKYFNQGSTMTERYAQTIDSIDIWNWYGLLISEASLSFATPERINKYGAYSDGSPIGYDERRRFRALANTCSINADCNPYTRVTWTPEVGPG